MNNLILKVQTITAMITTLGVWSNFMINYKFKEKFVKGELDKYGEQERVGKRNA